MHNTLVAVHVEINSDSTIALGADSPMMKAKEHPKLNPVRGSSYCEYSIIENRLEILYENQEKIYALLLEILKRLT